MRPLEVPRDVSGSTHQAFALELGSFEKVRADHLRAVRRLVWRLVHGVVDVDDVVQEVFYQVWRKLGDLREKTSLNAFVMGITFNVARASLRKARVRSFVAVSPTGVVPEVEDSVGGRDRELLEHLYTLLEALDSDSRLAFELRHVERRKLPEIAEQLGWSLSTTKRRLGRARRTLAQLAKGDVVLVSLTPTKR